MVQTGKLGNMKKTLFILAILISLNTVAQTITKTAPQTVRVGTKLWSIDTMFVSISASFVARDSATSVTNDRFMVTVDGADAINVIVHGWNPLLRKGIGIRPDVLPDTTTVNKIAPIH
jgi:hypothetical protein